MCRRQFRKPRSEGVFIKGTGLRTKLDVRRVWKCPQCDRIVKLRGLETSKICKCDGETWFMKLQEDLRWTRPHQEIKAVVEVRPDPDEFPDPPKQELPVEPEPAESDDVVAGDGDEATEASFGDGVGTPVEENEGLITSSLSSLMDRLNADDDDDDEIEATSDPVEPGSSDEKTRPGRKRRRRRRRRKRGSGESTEARSDGADVAAEANLAAPEASASSSAESPSPASGEGGESTGATKKKRRRRRRRRKKPEGGSPEE